MATPKFKKQIETMLAENKDLFSEYEKLEENYVKNPSKYKEELGEMRRKLLRIMRKHEDRLCARTENTKYANYSENLAMLFWQDIRAIFPNVEKTI
ncbi:hypothetical protein GYA27_04980 [candidate division WWE3 bacterium]|uniref:Uncharacterized protein n=1 Tax=candidate division WWE3 bacterium TaxID=2053526 RepID=A0A7X9DL91_UNCKA|nr:hypothetical protein [candidate division WWE3 bacterium]